MEIKFNGAKEFKKALERYPDMAKQEVGKFLVRANKEYRQTIKNNPWRIGMVGGGVPVDTGNLRDLHHTEIKEWTGRIYVDNAVGYRWFIHEGNKRMKARPWLDYTISSNEKKVDKLGDDMLSNLVKNLGK